MKKILSMTLVLTLIFSLVACSNKKNEPVDNSEPESSQTSDIETQEHEDSALSSNEDEFEEDNEANPKDDEETSNTVDLEEKPPIQSTQNDVSSSKPTQNTPAAKPGNQSPESKPEPNPTPSEPTVDNSTVGNVILSDFKNIMASSPSKSAEEIANKLLENPVMQFSGATMPVEEGLLNGFDNAEIKGFSEGVMFAPVIGSIPFVGYVFTTQDSSAAKSLVTTLKENANLRWNICVEAEEMLCHSIDNKVLFVMCPKAFE
ncbi:MAG: hypothetical protein IJB70_03830 [Clostridia bacterium]|nr:hypothetical protein [Clostridia bacterium]